jgi:hypothetical protein
VLGADVVVAELEGLPQGELENLLGPGREGDVARRRRAALADDLLHLGAHGLQGDAERLERLGRHPFALVDEAEEDVLRADVIVVEQAGLLLGEDHDPPGSIGEALEHLPPPAWLPADPAILRRPSGFSFGGGTWADAGVLLYR